MGFLKFTISIVLLALVSARFSLAPPGNGFGLGGSGRFGGRFYGLFPQFYQFSCPYVDNIVMSVLQKAIAKEPGIVASLLGLHFHDCFVQTVSCAEIVALAGRNSIVLSGGPSWELLFGRRESKTASLSGSNNNIPPPNSTIQNLIASFNRQGLDEADLVAFSGGHTIGVARCVSFKQRLYNQNGNNQPDETLERTYYHGLKSVCPRTRGDNNTTALDIDSPAKFGNVGNIAKLVETYADDEEGLFFQQFALSVVKMANMSPLTDFNGEARKNCRRVN